MKRLLMVVEGQTEEIFVNRVLQPHLAAHGVWATPTIVETRHLPGRARDKGGVLSWDKTRRDLQRRLADSSAFTTTMFDFYGLPDDFPGMQTPRTGEPYVDVGRVEDALAAEFASPRLIPFLALHELEAWVWASPPEVSRHFGDVSLVGTLSTVLSGFASVEHINHGRETAPSKRLMKLIPGYKKTSDGPTILQNVGLAALRAECPHLHQWVERLEQLGA